MAPIVYQMTADMRVPSIMLRIVKPFVRLGVLSVDRATAFVMLFVRVKLVDCEGDV